MDSGGVLAATEGQFAAGLLIGIILGLLLGPVLRLWLSWREWVDASRSADLTNRFLARWEQEVARSGDHTSGSEAGSAPEKVSPDQLRPGFPGKRPDGGVSNSRGSAA